MRKEENEKYTIFIASALSAGFSDDQVDFLEEHLSEMQEEIYHLQKGIAIIEDKVSPSIEEKNEAAILKSDGAYYKGKKVFSPSIDMKLKQAGEFVAEVLQDKPDKTEEEQIEFKSDGSVNLPEGIKTKEVEMHSVNKGNIIAEGTVEYEPKEPKDWEDKAHKFYVKYSFPPEMWLPTDDFIQDLLQEEREKLKAEIEKQVVAECGQDFEDKTGDNFICPECLKEPKDWEERFEKEFWWLYGEVAPDKKINTVEADIMTKLIKYNATEIKQFISSELSRERERMKDEIGEWAEKHLMDSEDVDNLIDYLNQ